MPKPILDLPYPGSVLERAYRASGNCTLRSIAVMVSFGFLAGAVIGAVGHYVGLLIPYLANLVVLLYGLLARYSGGCLGLAILISLVPIVAFIGLIYPLLIGAMIGYVTWLLAKLGKCRNPGRAGTIGFVNAAIGYGVFAFIAIQTSGMMHTTSGLIYSYFELTSTPWWLYVLVGLEAFIFTIGAAAVCYTQVEEMPFCEDCEKWYGSWQQKAYSLGLAEPLVQTLTSGSPKDLEDITRLSAVEYPHLIVKMRKCPSCQTSDFQLVVRIVWEEEKNGKGEKKPEIKKGDWFKAMVPAELGLKLERLLFVKV